MGEFYRRFIEAGATVRLSDNSFLSTLTSHIVEEIRKKYAR